jgi:hypothetical protein
MTRVLAILVCMAGVSHAAVVGVTETWPDASLRGWQQLDQSVGVPSVLNLGVSSGALELAPVINSSSTNDPRWSFVADAGASSGNFVGSLYDVGASTLEFDFYSSVPATLTAEWINDANLIIYHAAFPVGGSASNSAFSIQLDPDHFTHDPFSFSDDFEFLMKNTDQFWFTLDWDKDAVAPVFRIDNVQITGAGEGYGSWVESFGIDFQNSFSHLDKDGDGLLNGEEYNMDSDPTASNSPFTIAYTTNGLEWASSSNCQYTVLRSTNLVSGVFEPIDQAYGSGNTMWYQNMETNASAFYQIEAGRKP